jgi:hypothetical protein
MDLDLITDDDYYSLGIDSMPTDVGMTNEQSMGSIILSMHNRVGVAISSFVCFSDI